MRDPANNYHAGRASELISAAVQSGMAARIAFEEAGARLMAIVGSDATRYFDALARAVAAGATPRDLEQLASLAAVGQGVTAESADDAAHRLVRPVLDLLDDDSPYLFQEAGEVIAWHVIQAAFQIDRAAVRPSGQEDWAMSDAREALVALIEENGCLPPSDAQDIADAIRAAGWTPPGERVKPTVEDVAKVLLTSRATNRHEASTFPEIADLCEEAARAVLALFAGRTEREVKAEALRGAAQDARLCWTGTTSLRAQDDPEKAYSFDVWLDVRADHIEHRGA